MGVNNMWNSGKNIPWLRYANVLLLYAECLNETGHTSEAVDYVNEVRKRAWENNIPADKQWNKGMSKDQFFEALMTERVRELFGERWRRFDLVRTGKFLEYVKARNKWANRYGTIQNLINIGLSLSPRSTRMTISSAQTRMKGIDEYLGFRFRV